MAPEAVSLFNLGHYAAGYYDLSAKAPHQQLFGKAVCRPSITAMFLFGKGVCVPLQPFSDAEFNCRVLNKSCPREWKITD